MLEMLNVLMVLFVIYQLKHFIADYPLQGKYMLGKFKPGFGFVLPLLAHVAVHGAFTLVIAALFLAGDWSGYIHGFEDLCFIIFHFTLKRAAQLALFDMVCHFIMDRIKASPKLLGRFKPVTAFQYQQIMLDFKQGVQLEQGRAALKSNTLFWWCLGLDQMVHHLTHYAIIYMLVRSL